MARHEHEAEKIVLEVLVDRVVRIRALLFPLYCTTELLVLLAERLAPPDQIGRAMFCRRHEPGARSLRDARDRPLLERGNKRVLCELLSGPDVADEASQSGD